MFTTTPATFPPMLSIAFFTFATLSILVSLCAVTIIVESTILAKIGASVTIKLGVPSNIVMSNICLTILLSSIIFSDTNSSDGFGGTLPAVITNKLFISVF